MPVGTLVISSLGMLLTRLRRTFLGMCVDACESLLSLSVEQKVKAVPKFKDKVSKMFHLLIKTNTNQETTSKDQRWVVP